MNEDIIYLDHAAATPIDSRVLEDMLPYFTEHFYNPSSPYKQAVEVRRAYEAAKARIGVCIGAKGDEIIVTAGATESINLAFSGRQGHVVTSSIEHHAVLEAAKRHDITLVTPHTDGMIDSETIRKALKPDTWLVSIALANHELGTIQKLRDIAEIIHTERLRRQDAGEDVPIYFHTDASQGVGQVDVNVARLGVDMMTLNAAKIYGPKQVGLLWMASHVRLKPLIVGGGQERGLRSGTENVAGAIGFARALELASEHRNSETKRLAELRDILQDKLLTAFPEAIVSGSTKRRLSSHLHISFSGVDAERVVFGLENRGVLVATGSACAANKGTRSHVLVEIGMVDLAADGSLRLTLGRLTNEANIIAAAKHIIEVVGAEYARQA
ncbi:MAG: cysteine desulfurase family protein [Candidatus Saccharimonas sp.]